MKSTWVILSSLVILSLNLIEIQSQLRFESPRGEDVEESNENDTVVNTINVGCPERCLCVTTTVRCMFLQLEKIPTVSQETTALDLRFNRIREIPPNSFIQLKNLETLLLNDNQIAILEDGAFNGLIRLKFLYLYKNRIREIYPNVFTQLFQLTHLYLHFNQIREIHAPTFSNLTNLDRLFLQNNQIQRIPKGSFENLHKITRLRLDSNALVCDCGMLEFAQMLASHPDTQAAATCQQPYPMHGKSITQLSEVNFHCRQPVITEEPRDVEVNFGSTVYFSCKADGDPAPKIVWLHNDNEISLSNEPRYSILNDGTLMIAKANEEDAGTYECMAKSTVGEAKSRRANMETKHRRRPHVRPRFTKVPRDMEVKEGERLLLNCSASGAPTPNITWFFGDVAILSNENRFVQVEGGLVVEAVEKRHSGVFQCTASNSLGKVSSIAKVHVFMPPVWIVTPLEQSVQKGAMLSLHCEASGEPTPVITWIHNGQIVTGDGHRVVLMQSSAQLVLKSTLQEDEGEYVCRVENSGGFLESAANIRVIAGTPPQFTMNELFTNASSVDSSMRLKCGASGVPTPNILWKKDGLPIIENGRISVLPGGMLIVHDFNPILDSGVYACSAFNDHGFITSDSLDVSSDGIRLIKKESVDNTVLLNAVSQARREVEVAESDSLEALFGNMSKAEIRSPYDLFRLMRFPKAEARDIARSAEIYERALHLISKHAEKMDFNLGGEFSYNDLLSPIQLELLSRFSGCVSHIKPRTNCSSEMCFHSRYRTIDGACNNLAQPNWGSSYTTFQRLLEPVYENGFNLPIGWTPGKLYNGHPKPLARLISSQIIKTDHITPDDTITHMVMQWGQFLDHDLDHALPSLSVESYGERVSCRRTCTNVAPCFPMQTPENDVRVRTRKCMEFTRSAAVCGTGITSMLSQNMQHREQINQLTSYIDASQVYGSSVPEILSLQSQSERSYLRKGIYMYPNKALMPFATDDTPVDCRRNFRESDVGCFLGGDIRVNEQLGLLAMHTIWFRQHNWLAEQLRRLNPTWFDEVVFQEARKIVGGQMQHITYAHWLPFVIGDKGMEELGSYRGYDPTVNPAITTEFSTAALRFGHTLINPVLRRLDANFDSIPEGDLPLRLAFFSPWRLVEEGGVDPVMRGLFATSAKLKRPDELLNSHLTEDLFAHAHLVALDLAAMNIQRGRDHGIPSYNEYRVLCNLSRAYSFDDLKKEIPDDGLRKKLADVYKSVENIDLWVGGVAEEVEGAEARVGPTFRCILVDQFKRLRDGDRFWYENPSVFRPEQLIEIKQSSLARILCDTGDALGHVKRNVFLMNSPLVPCSQLPSPQVGFWVDSESCCNDKSRPTCPALTLGQGSTNQIRRRGRRNLERAPNAIANDVSSNPTNLSTILAILETLQKNIKALKSECSTHVQETNNTIIVT